MLRHFFLARTRFVGLALAALVLATLSVGLGRASTAEAAFTLPTVGNWTINGNGHVGVLDINLNASGIVTGTAYGNPITGYWDEQDRKITFIRRITSGDTGIQVFTGYYFKTNGGTGAHVLAGSFEAFSATGGTPERSVFGWYATKLGD
jgi:hypothetical protein